MHINHQLVLENKALYFKKFVACKTLVFEPLNNPVPSFQNLTAAYSGLDALILKSNYDVQLAGDVFELIVHNPLLTYLFLETYQKMESFDFLFKLGRLKELGLCLYHPIDADVVLELIKKLPLNFVDISFIRPPTMSMEQLSAFKKRVNQEAAAQIKTRELFFKITLHTNAAKQQIVRYHLKTVKIIGEYGLFDEKRIFESIQFK